MGQAKKYPTDAARQKAYRDRKRNATLALDMRGEKKGRPRLSGARDSSGKLLTADHGVVSIDQHPLAANVAHLPYQGSRSTHGDDAREDEQAETSKYPGMHHIVAPDATWADAIFVEFLSRIDRLYTELASIGGIERAEREVSKRTYRRHQANLRAIIGDLIMHDLSEDERADLAEDARSEFAWFIAHVGASNLKQGLKGSAKYLTDEWIKTASTRAR